MESLIGYASDDETAEYNEDTKDGVERSGSALETDDNYDNVQMDMSEDSNMIHSSDTSLSDASSDGENQKTCSSKYSDENRKKEMGPSERERDVERSGFGESRQIKTGSNDRVDQVKAKSRDEERHTERREKSEEWTERSNDKRKSETHREKLEESIKKLEERRRKSDDTKRHDDRKETKAGRDNTRQGRDEKKHASNDNLDREVKDRHKESHRDNRERGIDERRPRSREKVGKERRRSDDLKDEKRGHSRKDDRKQGGKLDEKRIPERVDDKRSEDRQDNKYGDERKTKDKVRKDSKRDRSRSPRRPVAEDKAKRNRSRSPSSHHSTKSHSPLVSERKNTGEKRGASPRRGDHKRSKHSPDHRRRSRSRDKHSPDSRRRSRSRERSLGRPRTYDKKPSKLSILERLGISLPSVSEVSGAITPQELVQRSMQAQVQQVKSKTGIELPSYYNPAAMNPARYAEQIQKRRLLWGNKTAEPQEKKPAEVTPGLATGNNWEGTTFAADNDGKMTAKFKRLMGIKNQGGASSSTEAPSDGSKPEIIKKQEELFSSMEMQYEVARVATHTHRGLGLGFGTFQYPR